MTELIGITKTVCPSGCNAGWCVISDVGHCAHPMQGGLQFALKNEASLARYGEACKAIDVRNVHEMPERLTS
jgi:hypothetical protein